MYTQRESVNFILSPLLTKYILDVIFFLELMNSNFSMSLDDYEKSTKEFEKYVNTIPKKVPVKFSKSNTIGSLVKDYLQKAEFTETQELYVLTNVLQSLKSWGRPEAYPPIPNTKLLELCERHSQLSLQLEALNKQLIDLCEEIEYKTAETNGFATTKEIEDVIKVLNTRINKQEGKSKENEKIMFQIQDLVELLPQVKRIEKLIENAEVLEREKDLVVEYLEETNRAYQELVALS